ncbi:MAG: DUF2752 domain-containing protein [Candidatus Nanopelagicales bacterium]
MSTQLAPESVVTAERVDTRPRGRRLVAPLLTGALTVGALGYLFAVDPNEPGHFPLCPTKALLGIDCPGCGCMRGLYALTHGDLAGAADHNLLLLLAVPFAVVLWVRWLMRAWRGVSPAVSMRTFRLRNRLMIIALVAILAFGVVRNYVPYLDSAA